MGRNVLGAALPEDWEVTTLGEVVAHTGGSIQTGPFGSQLHASDYVQFGTPSIMPVNIGDGRVDATNIARITSDDAERLSRYQVVPGDIVYSRRGDVERHALVQEAERGWLCGTGCIKIHFGEGEVLSRYASYYLRHPAVREWISRHAVGATMPNLNTSIMAAIPFVRPPIQIQRAIATILGRLDDKIELNRRMSETLEKMAAALFKSWFVDFDPTHAKAEGRDTGLPEDIAALFPSEFEDSELGEIPKRWRVGRIGDVATNVHTTCAADEIADDTHYVGLEHFQRHRLTLWDWGVGRDVSSTKNRFDIGDILFGKLRPYFHKVVLAPIGGVCSTDVLVIRAKGEVWKSFAALALFRDEVVAHATQASNGTRMPRTKWSTLSAFPMTVPDEGVAERFEGACGHMLEQIRSMTHENKALAELRDTLLPKLLSGEIEAPEVEEQAEDVLA